MSSMSPPPGRPGARAPVRYSPELGRMICERIAAGASEHGLAREPGMPSRRCFRDWALRDAAFGQALRAAKAAARRARLAERRAQDGAAQDMGAQDGPAQNGGQGWRRMLSRAGRRGGSVSILTPELTEAICARIAAGESVLSIGADPAMPGAVSIYGWARRDDEFREAYLRAKEIGSHMLFDVTREIALETTEATVRGDRLRVETLRWQVAMLAPKTYGGPQDRAQAEAEAEEIRPWTVVIRRFSDEDDVDAPDPAYRGPSAIGPPDPGP